MVGGKAVTRRQGSVPHRKESLSTLWRQNSQSGSVSKAEAEESKVEVFDAQPG
jgi:hypothetical protein